MQFRGSASKLSVPYIQLALKQRQFTLALTAISCQSRFWKLSWTQRLFSFCSSRIIIHLKDYFFHPRVKTNPLVHISCIIIRVGSAVALYNIQNSSLFMYTRQATKFHTTGTEKCKKKLPGSLFWIDFSTNFAYILFRDCDWQLSPFPLPLPPCSRCQTPLLLQYMVDWYIYQLVNIVWRWFSLSNLLLCFANHNLEIICKQNIWRRQWAKLSVLKWLV